jgi:hypothetical protein
MLHMLYSTIESLKAYVCMYVCMYVGMYVCMYVCVCIYIYIYRHVLIVHILFTEIKTLTFDRDQTHPHVRDGAPGNYCGESTHTLQYRQEP